MHFIHSLETTLVLDGVVVENFFMPPIATIILCFACFYLLNEDNIRQDA